MPFLFSRHATPLALSIRLTVPALSALLSVFTSALVPAAHAQITVKAYISAPNTQTAPSSITNKTAETFNSQTAGTKTSATFSSAIGVYNPSGTPAASAGTYAIVADDNYGTGTSNYFSIGAQSGSATPVTLTFNSVVQYFGLSYNAADNNNGFTLYDESDKLIGRYSTAKLVAALSPKTATVTAMNGNKYTASQFYGKPTATGTTQSTTNDGEAYAFLSFVVEGGTVVNNGGTGSKGIKKIVFDNSGSTGTGFESDNHTISTAIQNVTGGDFVYVGTTDAPEASTLALLSAGLPLLAGGFAFRARRILKGAA